MSSHYNEDVLELGPNIGNERKSTRFLEISSNENDTRGLTGQSNKTYLKHNCDDVISNMTLSGELLSETINQQLVRMQKKSCCKLACVSGEKGKIFFV